MKNQTQTQKIKNQPQNTHNTNTPRNFKIKLNVLQNIRTQIHESPLIQQNQPKSNSNSIQGKQMHKLRNTNLWKRKKEKESYPDVKKEERKKEKKKKKEKE